MTSFRSVLQRSAIFGKVFPSATADTFVLAHAASGDILASDAECPCRIMGGLERFYHIAIFIEPCNWLCKMVLSIKALLNALTVQTIVAVLLASTPFEITHRVVSWVLVLVVYLWQVVWVRDESESHKAMHCHVLRHAMFRERYTDVAVMCKFWLQWSWNFASNHTMMTGVLSH